jgi:hypothetical protein
MLERELIAELHGPSDCMTCHMCMCMTCMVLGQGIISKARGRKCLSDSLCPGLLGAGLQHWAAIPFMV